MANENFFEFLSEIHVAPSYFAMMINVTLKWLEFFFAYLGDIIMYSNSGKDHLDHLHQIVDHLHKANIKLKLTKIQLFQKPHPLLGKLDAVKSM